MTGAADSESMVVDSLMTRYSKRGSGKVVVLLHGWGDSRATFVHLQTMLAQHYTVISLDLPGFGQTEAPKGVWNLDNYARFVQAFLEKSGAPAPYAFIAHSNGGAVAIRGMALGVLKADRLVLLGASGIRTLQKGRRVLVKIVAKSGKAATFWLPERHKRRLRKKLYGVAGSDMLVAPHLQETFKRTVRQDVQQDAQKLRVPTLLLYGQNDVATPPLYGEMYQKLIPHARLHVVADAGHFVHQDQTHTVERMISEFLA